VDGGEKVIQQGVLLTFIDIPKEACFALLLQSIQTKLFLKYIWPIRPRDNCLNRPFKVYEVGVYLIVEVT
jgi:hypothetical protein